MFEFLYSNKLDWDWPESWYGDIVNLKDNTNQFIPDEECVKLLPMMFKQGFILRVNSEQVQRDASSPTVFSISNAVQYCNQKQKGNTITLFMY